MNTNGRRLFRRAGGWLTGVMLFSLACGTTVMANGVVLTGTASEADIHEQADESSPVLATLSGIQATVLETRDGWTKIQVGEISGWVENEYLADGSDTLNGIAPVNPEGSGQTDDTEEQTGEKQTEVTDEDTKDPEGQAADQESSGRAEVAVKAQAEAAQAAAKAQAEAAAKAQEEAVRAAQAQAEAVAKAQAEAVRAAQAQAEAVAKAQEEAVRAAKAQAEAAAKAQEEAVRAAQAQAEAAAKAQAEAAQAAAQAQLQATVMAQTGVSAQELELLAALIQCEAGGESYVGQVAVGNVVMNRVESERHPDSISEVIYASGQFSPVRNGSLSRTLGSGRISDSCRQAALEAVAGSSPVGELLYFRRVNGRDGLVIGNHVFY